MATQVIVLNGGSSSGKSGIARCLQAILPDPWLAFGTDNLIQAMPTSLRTSAAGIEFGQDGEVIVGPQFRTLEAAWIAGIAAMATRRTPKPWPAPRRSRLTPSRRDESGGPVSSPCYGSYQPCQPVPAPAARLGQHRR